MRNYDVFILNKSEFYSLVKKYPEFDKIGFLKQNIDYQLPLSIHFKKPVISVRPSGRSSWEEVLILCAKEGYMQNDTAVLCYQTVEEFKNIFMDIFLESDANEMEVFEQYKLDCPKEVKEKIRVWVKEVF